MWSRTNYSLSHFQMLYQMSYGKWCSELDLNQRPPESSVALPTELPLRYLTPSTLIRRLPRAFASVRRLNLNRCCWWGVKFLLVCRCDKSAPTTPKIFKQPTRSARSHAPRGNAVTVRRAVLLKHTAARGNEKKFILIVLFLWRAA